MSDPTGSSEHPEVGGVGEEAAKLLGALSEWAGDQSDGVGAGIVESLAQGWGHLAGQAASTVGEINEHIATGAPECTYCPVCRTVHVIRGTSPEVRAHLATAASSFLQAMAGLVASMPPGQPSRSSGFERIHLEDDEPEGDA